MRRTCGAGPESILTMVVMDSGLTPWAALCARTGAPRNDDVFGYEYRMTIALMPLEKTPLETYVPPAKPSLIGLSRAEISEQLGAIGVAPPQRKMRTQQLWHWIYVRGVQGFDEMTTLSKAMREDLATHFTL